MIFTDMELQQGLIVMHKRLCDEYKGFMSAIKNDKTIDQLITKQQFDGSWDDIRYDENIISSFHGANHLHRLKCLTHAWHKPDSPNYQEEQVLNAILTGLDYWLERNLIHKNWWWNEIGVPLLLCSCLIYISDQCSTEQLNKTYIILRRFESNMTFYTGQNLVWIASIRIQHGIIAKEPALTSEGFIWLGRELSIHPRDDGIQPDQSFFQHGLLLYSGGYGAGFIADVSHYIMIAADTVYAWPDSKINILSRFILEGTAWMVRGRAFDYGTIGREITRPGHSAANFYQACKNMSSLPCAQKKTFAKISEHANQPAFSSVQGNRHFWCADLMTHHRPSFYASARMTSDRVYTSDMACCGGEGRLNHHMAEGATFFLQSGDEYRDIFPVWNWQQIPGTTAEQLPDGMNPDTLRQFGESNFAGGVSNGQVGAAAMIFKREELSARKSVFFFDDAVVCLGAEVSSTNMHPVLTTIDQCHWNGSVKKLSSGMLEQLETGNHMISSGNHIWHNNTLINLLDGHAELYIGNQYGSWNDCGVSSPDQVSLPVFNLGISHNRKATTYAYIVRPGVSEDMLSHIPEESYKILANTNEKQVIWNNQQRLFQGVFYKSSKQHINETLTVSVDRPCMLLFHQEENKTIHFAVSDPTQQEKEIKVTFDGHIKNELRITLPANENAGQSVCISLRTE